MNEPKEKKSSKYRPLPYEQMLSEGSGITTVKMVQTESFRHFWNYFLNLLNKEFFKRTVEILRKKYQVPRGGYEYFSKRVAPEEWLKKHGNKKYRHLHKNIKELYGCLELNNTNWIPIIEKYLFCYTITFNDFKKLLACYTEDNTKSKTKFSNQSHPISLKISPNASKREIIDYIQKNYALGIQPLQNKYNIKRPGLRTHRNQQINNFVYEKRNLGWKNKKIAEALNSKFKEIKKPTDISKIYQIEENRRRK